MSESLNVGRTGKRNLLPSKQAQRDYLRDLRAAADAGDVLAMGLLVGLAKLEEHSAETRSYRLRRDFEQVGGTPTQIIDRAKRYMLDALERLEDEDQPRDAAGIQQGQGPRDAVPVKTADHVCSTTGGHPVKGESDSRRNKGDEHQPQAEQETQL
jgi:hypothetical protein